MLGEQHQMFKNYLKEHQIKGVMLHVGLDNVRAQAFYRKCGFQELNRDKHGVLMGMKLMYTKTDLINDLEKMGLKPTDTIMVHVRNIRDKIEIDPKKPKYLKVVWGIGYKIEKDS